MLARAALRIATVHALRGRTLVGAHVGDSDLAPIDDIAAERATPVVIVYTDDGKFSTQGRDLFATGGDSRVDVGYQQLVIEVALTQRMAILDDAGQPDDDVVQPKTDAALELLLDIIERQIIAALMDASPGATWAGMWKRLALDIGDRESQRGASLRDGVRLAGRQLRLSVRLPRDPKPGTPPGELWAAFLALAATEPGLAPVLPMLTAAFAGDALPDWRQIMGTYGLSIEEARALQIAPPPAAAAAPVSFAVPLVDPVDATPASLLPLD